MKHKILKTMIVLIFGVLLCSFMACNCNGSGNNSSSDGIYDMPTSGSEQKLTLDNSECFMTVGDELQLYAQYTPQENASLTWSSSDETVVTVADGKLLAQMAGESTITATYGELTATCKVSVSFGNMYPSIDFENGMEETLTTNTAEKVNFAAKTKFNGKVFSDGTFSYTLSGTIGQMSQDGTFTPTAEGTGEVVITMQWRGFTVEKTVSLTVTSVKTILINDGLVSEIVLYGCGEFGGNTYPTSQALEIEAFEDNQTKEYEMEILNNDGVVAYDDVTKTVTALQGGTAELKISFESNNGETFYKILPITVKKHTVQATIPLFSVLDGIGKGEENLQTLLDGDTLIKAESAGASLTVVDGYKLTGLTAIGDAMSEIKVKAESKSFIYNLTLETYTKVLTTAQDFVDAFNVDDAIAGYYYLANDIEPKQDGGYESVKLTKGIISTKAFKGTFDGAGHTINLEIGNGNGLFGYLWNATVKNARFNLRMAANAGTENVGLAQYVFGDNNYLTDVYVNVENLSNNCTNFGTIALYCNGDVGYTRVVIETPTAEELSGYNTAKMGAIAQRINFINATTGQEWRTGKKVNTDVFVISPLFLAVEASGGAVWAVCTQNQMPDKNGDDSITRDDIDTTNKITYLAQDNYSTLGKLYSYASAADLIAKTHDLAAYTESGYWDISTGAPVWKGNN